MTAQDAAAVAQIWRDGLQQTAAASPWWIRTKMADGMQKYGESALKEDGDVGPDGNNLMPKWNDPPADATRRMFVAVLDDNNGRNNENERVVGAVGVRKGYEEKEEHDPDCKLASIWRMSVDSSARRQGIGLALMEKAEDWARENKCTRMKLVTANPVAGRFYVEKAGYEKQAKETATSWWWWQHIPQPWRSAHEVIHEQIHFFEKEL